MRCACRTIRISARRLCIKCRSIRVELVVGTDIIGFDRFKFFYILSSYQDTFIPFYSERAEVNPQIEQSTREESVIVSEMVSNFWSDLKKADCKTVIKKFDICTDVLI